MGNKCDIGVLGLAVMGQNIVLNMESSGYNVAVYNRTTSVTRNFMKKRAVDKNIESAESIREFISLLEKPRKVMLMVKAGKPVDYVIESVLPYLEEGDIIIDGGNSHFSDTDRRCEVLAEHNIKYLGTGISGGEYGALNGPSIMPGGDEDAYAEVSDIFHDIAAITDHGACVSYLGPRSAGHYVKMIHNGIEYGVMQLIAETYDIMRKALNLLPAEMGDIFSDWNLEQESYLIEITSEILHRIDPDTEKPLVDVILDEAKQKGTGKWSVQDALELGISIPTITAAVNARNISGYKEERVTFSDAFSSPENYELEESYIDVLKDALFLAIVTAYTEGMNLLQGASAAYDYNLPLDEVARIWEDGCIIRSELLQPIQLVYQEKPYLSSLILSEQFEDIFRNKISNLRKVVVDAKKMGIPVPAFSAALDYFDSLRTIELPTNMIQAQRDYFGAHTYQRRDKEGVFHTEWQDIHNV
ncbi:MAG: NADP-dependent phosphogluconate dehydrogenase [Halanaerobiaceae bacterium]